MANRRMFSKHITNAAKFLKMPLEVQALYFHLGQNADDDGVVEGFTIMRLVGASEDSMKLLAAKKFIEILNEDLVVFILDWRENNNLRPDRKKDTIYKDLLLQRMPDVLLLEPTTRSDRQEDDNGTSQGQTLDGLGKVRLGKDIKDNTSEIDSFFENVWNCYPRKEGKNKVKKAKRKQLFALGDELIRAVERYNKRVKADNTDKQYIKMGSTFFNGDYEDYLDSNYQEIKRKPQDRPDVIEDHRIMIREDD